MKCELIIKSYINSHWIREMKKRISPAAIQCLKEALTYIFWYKRDLRSFLYHALESSNILARINWDDLKRNIAHDLVNELMKDQEKYQTEIIDLMNEVCQMEDFSHLRRLDDGKKKETLAKEAVSALRKQFVGHQQLVEEIKQMELRRERAHKKSMQIQAVQQKLNELSSEYALLLGSTEPNKRGYRLEKILRELFEIFDLDPKASFKITGEQIDGAFSFEMTDYLLEAKWQKSPVAARDMDSLTGKLSRKLDNTLGLFISINGFAQDSVKAVSSGRRLIILMDGSDLMAVLEARIDLGQLLLRKRRNAAETGNIYLRFHEFL